MKNAVGDVTDYVTKDGGTEPAFNNAYWDEHRPGIYVDVNTDEVLFTSMDKFDSGTGWPSFTKPVENASIYEKEDYNAGMKRIEVRTTETHLGHKFDDGPAGSTRYCINSAALRFIPYTELNSAGFSEYEKLFPYAKAIFAAGCFWCVQNFFESVPGVVLTQAGYTGGTTPKPTYRNIGDHAESVLVVYDITKITYKELVEYFWRMHDPTQLNAQGPDIGAQYRSAIYYVDESQEVIAMASKKSFDKSGVFAKPSVTEILPASEFFPAEEYHQDYIKKNGATCHPLRDK